MPSAFAASVVFLRIQDFARRPASEQARLRAQLEAVVAVIAAELAAERRIVLDASDGAAVVVLRDPRGALRLAERALAASSAGLPLCAGLNHGTLQTVGRKNNEGLTGDGIAVAASIAQFTAPGRLFASRGFRDALADAAGSVGVIVAGVVVLATGWEKADPLVSIIIGVLILVIVLVLVFPLGLTEAILTHGDDLAGLTVEPDAHAVGRCIQEVHDLGKLGWLAHLQLPAGSTPDESARRRPSRVARA